MCRASASLEEDLERRNRHKKAKYSALLVKKYMEKKLDNMLKNADKKSERKIAEKDVFDLFGI